MKKLSSFKNLETRGLSLKGLKIFGGVGPIMGLFGIATGAVAASVVLYSAVEYVVEKVVHSCRDRS